MKKLIENREDVGFLVRSFYAKVRSDKLLAPIFNTIIAEDQWEEHLEKLTDFWETNLFGVIKFKGNPGKAHQEVDKYFNHSISPEHFGRWINLWITTINENFQGEKAEKAMESARKMGTYQYMAIWKGRKNKT